MAKTRFIDAAAAAALIKDGDTGTAVVWARHQTGGRGRDSRHVL